MFLGEGRKKATLARILLLDKISLKQYTQFSIYTLGFSVCFVLSTDNY